MLYVFKIIRKKVKYSLKKIKNLYLYNTSWSPNDKIQKYSYRTNTYGKNSIIISAIESWNNSQNNLKTISLRLLTPSKIKLLLSNEYLKNY